jgi:hypothetical protein
MEGVLKDYGVSTVLAVAHLQLYFVSAKKESCLSLYIVQGSHRIDEREIHNIDSTSRVCPLVYCNTPPIIMKAPPCVS